MLQSMAKKSRRGRRPGQPATKDAILRVARRCFGERGYDATTVRAIARAAGVDQALIHHYFGTKRALFDEAVPRSDGVADEPAGRLATPGDPGEGLVLAFFARWDAAPEASRLETLLRAAGSDSAAQRLLRELIGRSFTAPATLAIPPGTDLPRLRAALVAAQLIGLAWMRYVERREPLVSASPRLLARTYGPAVTAALTARKG